MHQRINAATKPTIYFVNNFGQALGKETSVLCILYTSYYAYATYRL